MEANHEEDEEGEGSEYEPAFMSFVSECCRSKEERGRTCRGRDVLERWKRKKISWTSSVTRIRVRSPPTRKCDEYSRSQDHRRGRLWRK